jgi:predicted hydrocarbon binding protein
MLCMNSQDFLAAGYRQYKETSFRHAEFLLQKRIYDVIGTKYFINIYLYDLQGEEVFDSETQFTKNLKLYCIAVSRFQSVEEIEKIFEDLWERMCFDYQERTS